MKAVLVLLLLSLITTTVSNGGVFRPAHATTLTGLGIWSATYRSPAILNASLVMNSFIVLRLNVTGGASINGFDANVTWNPTVLIYKNDTLKGSIFDPANVSFVPLAHNSGPGFVRWAGVINGGTVQGNGTVFTFTLKVVSNVPGSTTVHIAKGVLTQPRQFSPIAMDGFFSNIPSNSDLILTSMNVTKETVTLGDVVDINVGIRNIGATPMVGVVVTLTYNNTLPINSTSIGTVTGNSALTAKVVWNTTSFALGLYNLNATVTTNSLDSFLGDNSLSLEQVTLVTHDLAVTSLIAPSSALVNTTVLISITLQNLGTVQDTANIIIMANATLAASGSFQLSPGSASTQTLGWNTTGITPGHYGLVATVQPVLGERNLVNNVYVGGSITIKTFFGHDLGITGNLPASAIVGQNATFTFLVINSGLNSEDYTVRVILDGQVILQSPQTTLAPSTNATVTFPPWNTQPYTPGGYTLSANVTSTSTDENLVNNRLSTQFTLNANMPPLVSFAISPSVPGPGVSAVFNGTMSFDPDGDPLASYSWSFGDASANQTGSIANHAYASSGSYTVTLTVTDILGARTILQKQLRVNALPSPSFTVSSAAPQAGSPLTFDASASSDGDGTIDSYQWTFGDGSTASGKTVTHTYGAAGTYSVKLKVTDNNGGTKEYSLTVDVAPAPVVSQVVVYAIAGVVVVAAGLASWFLLSRRRRSPPSSLGQKRS